MLRTIYNNRNYSIQLYHFTNEKSCKVEIVEWDENDPTIGDLIASGEAKVHPDDKYDKGFARGLCFGRAINQIDERELRIKLYDLFWSHFKLTDKVREGLNYSRVEKEKEKVKTLSEDDYLLILDNTLKLENR